MSVVTGPLDRKRGDEHFSPLRGHAPTHAGFLSGVGGTPCILRVAIGERSNLSSVVNAVVGVLQ